MSRAARACAVLALSAGTLAYEILLVRVFAIEQFHHFASMAVGVAMLGIGAAGTAFSLAQGRGAVAADRWFVGSALLTALGLLASPIIAELLRVDATALAWDGRQWARLGALYLVLATPFGFGALAILAALAQSAERPGALYGASLVGSGLGAALAVALLWGLTPVRAIALPAVLGSLGAALAAQDVKARRPVRAAALAIALAAGVVAALPRQPRLIPYKSLAQVLAYPDARVVTERTDPVGWVVAVDAPAFRHLPGLSLAYRGGFPRQTGVFVDGDLAGAIPRWDGGSERLLDWQPSSLPFSLRRPRRVLVLGGAAGLAVATALRTGAAEVVAVELQPDLVELFQESSAAAGEAAAEPQWVASGARAYAAAARRRFDVVVLGPLGGGGAGGAANALREDYDHTVEAYRRYLELLDQGGVLAITTWTAEPPRAELRMVLTAAEALRGVAPEAVAQGIVVVRSWGTVTVLVKPDGFDDAEITALEAWAAERWFDVDWRPGLAAPRPRYNLVERPTVFEAVRTTVAGPDSARRFVAAYPFDVRPATDHRPYPHHFIGVKGIRWLLERPRGDWLPFAEWGHLALLVTLLQSALLAAVLMGVPAALRAGRPPGGSVGRLVGYFMAIGVGYLAAEIAAMQQLTLLLGHPVYAVAAVLAGVLAVSGVGSLMSDRRPASQASRLALLLAVVLAGYAVGLLPVAQALQSAPLPVRVAAALLLLVPAALLMGAPFPLGVRALAGPEPARLAWAWAANGFASVITAPIAALVALGAGHSVVFGLAAGAYATAAALAQRPTGSREPPRTAPAS